MRTILSLLIILFLGIAIGYALSDDPPPGWELYWHVAAIAFGIIFTSPAFLFAIVWWLLNLGQRND